MLVNTLRIPALGALKASEEVRRVAVAALSSAALAAIASLAAPGAAWSQQHVVVFAGGEVDNASFGYVGGTFALPGAEIGHGFAVRVSGFGGGYGYTGGPLIQHINGVFGGTEVDGVYQFSQGGLWINGVVGGRYVDTRLSPGDPTNRRNGEQWEVALGLDGGYVSGPWRTDWYGSYGTRLDDYQARLSLTHALGGGAWRAGVEGAVDGDPAYNAERVGPYVGYVFAKNAEVQFSAGFSDSSFRGAGGYARVGFNEGF